MSKIKVVEVPYKVGTARLFGIDVIRNFNYPCFSRDIAEFCRRWHISLNTWFRDYVYIPLDGSRRGRMITARNTLVIFLLNGLWHSANWTFIARDAYYVLFFIPLILSGKNRKYTGAVSQGRSVPYIKEFIMMLSTFFIVTVGWIIFRSENTGQAWEYISNVFSFFIFFWNYVR